MELTITQNGALYALQHGATNEYRLVRRRPVIAELIRIMPTLTTSMTEKVQFARQNAEAQVAAAFPEYRVAA
jgi:hypothetical protein